MQALTGLSGLSGLVAPSFVAIVDEHGDFIVDENGNLIIQ